MPSLAESYRAYADEPTLEWLKHDGHDLAVLGSQNLPDAIESNRAVGVKYKHCLSEQLA